MANPPLFRLIDKAVYEYSLIEPGDRILIGVSGGKDSTALAQYFSARKKRQRENFEFTALHVSAGFAPPISPFLLQAFRDWDVPLRVVPADAIERLKEGRKMNCWWCSTQRRTELNSFAMREGYNKIALGHHLDDILETLLMNMTSKGELSTMPPRLQYKKYPVVVIRPLCFADEKTIIAHAQKAGFSSQTCTCSYQDNSARRLARKRLAALTDDSPRVKQKIFKSLRNVKKEYLAYPPEKSPSSLL